MQNPKIFAVNRRARYEYDILDTVEAGISLLGSEIKAIRQGHSNITEAYAKHTEGELWLLNCHIAPYSAGAIQSHDPTRPRKLLLHRSQIISWSNQITGNRLTIIPLKLYLSHHLAKVELGLARGRRIFDKRKAIIDRLREREASQALNRRR